MIYCFGINNAVVPKKILIDYSACEMSRGCRLSGPSFIAFGFQLSCLLLRLHVSVLNLILFNDFH